MTDAPRPSAPRQVPVMLLAPGARLPERAYENDAAFDLFSVEDAIVAPQHRQVIRTGVALGLPPGLAALTLPRSGLAAEHGVTLVNTPGLIDPGYRGEVRIILLNTDRHHPFHVGVGDRIAQLLIVGLTEVSFFETVRLDDTHRGERGFGSSGTGFGSPPGDS
ncbi:MAG TPA: dUTP diphosphatase [Thermoleophilia bacterium]|nr:dUTP diphosphatase [Thermoleophilia bacterium]